MSLRSAVENNSSQILLSLDVLGHAVARADAYGQQTGITILAEPTSIPVACATEAPHMLLASGGVSQTHAIHQARSS